MKKLITNTAFALLGLVMFAFTANVNAQTTYGLKIAGVDVTSVNAGDLTVIQGVSVASGGAVTYNHSTRTLTLNKATITVSSSFNGIDNKSIDGLKIVLIGANLITTNGGASCAVFKNTEISGSGSLSLSATGGDCGIYIDDNTTLTIEDCNITASGNWGIAGNNGTYNENLVINNATVKATGSSKSISDLASLTLNGCTITAPPGAAFDNSRHAVALNGTVVTQQVVIEPNTVAYGLKIAGVQVTSANASDLTVIQGVSVANGGAVTYNHTTQTLTLNKATITPSSDTIGIYNQNIDGLKIVLTGANQITTTNKNSCTVLKNTEISGNGSLSLSSIGHCGIYIASNTTLTIKDCNITASGYWGITGYNGTSNEHLVIDNATVNATGNRSSITDLASLTLNGCAITAPQGAAFDNALHAVALDGTKVTQQVVIAPVVAYGLYIAGEVVTSANADDLTVIDGVSVASGGAVTYNHTTKTLTLNKATITPSSNTKGIYNQSIDGLKIVLIGANQITTNGTSCAVYKNTEISGSGSLSLSATGYCGIYINENTTLIIKDCNITASGRWGIAGNNGTSNENLVINNATVNATGSNGSIADIASLTLNGCAITAPQGAAFNNSLHAVALNGTKVTQQVVIAPVVAYGLYIAGEVVTSANADDLTVIEGVSVASGGAVTYNHTTQTLTLNKATITVSSSSNGIYNQSIDGLKIVLIGANQITTNNASCSLFKNTEISGNGSLSLSSTGNCGIYIDNNTTLTIEDCNITASGKWGITGYDGTYNEHLVINNATVNATGGQGSIADLSSLTLNGCAITAPQGAAFDNTLHAVALNGTVVTQQVVIEPNTMNIDEVKTTNVFTFYPNPAQDMVTIELSNSYTGMLQIADLSGKIVISRPIEGTRTSVDISTLSKGIYLVKVGSQVNKLIVK